MIVGRIALGLAQVSHLRPKSREAIQRHLQFLIVSDHGVSATISPLWLLSRLI
jgi:hypothetical protein